ncbi:MAG: CHAD domain-containing protein [Casimicrobiaceae bacterium]
MASGIEIEIRLVGSGKTLNALTRARAFARVTVGDATTQHLETTYWDTPDYAFRNAGMALRVRTRDGGTPLLSLKTDRAEALARDETEVPLETDVPDLEGLVAAGWSPPRALRKLHASPQPVFASRVTRRVHPLTFADGTVAELALDRGELRTAGAEAMTERVDEVEIELVQGDPRRILELAVSLMTEFPALRLLLASKAERAFRLRGGVPAAARRARNIAVNAKEPAGMIAVRAAAEALAQVAANVEGESRGNDVDHVHQLRIGIRRWRIAVTLARAAGLPLPSATLRAEIDSVWSLLGSARDWDVFEHQTWPAMHATAVGRDLSGARDQALMRERSARHQALRSTLTGQRFHQALLVALWAVENQREFLQNATSVEHAKSLARAVLRKRMKQVRRRGDKLAELLPDDLHRLRIDAKKLRYAAEFAALPFAKGAVKRFLRRLRNVQSTLGAMHDLDTAQPLLDPITRAGPTETRGPLHATWQAYAGARRKRLARRLARDWKRLDNAKPFWR